MEGGRYCGLLCLPVVTVDHSLLADSKKCPHKDNLLKYHERQRIKQTTGSNRRHTALGEIILTEIELFYHSHTQFNFLRQQDGVSYFVSRKALNYKSTLVASFIQFQFCFLYSHVPPTTLKR